MAPRSLWNGAISFGLVNVPIKVYSATESKTVHFHEVHVSDGARIEHRRECPKHGEVGYDEIVKGFEIRRGEWVELDDDDVKAAAGPQSRLIDIDHFVPAADIDPEFYEKTYYLGAGEDADDAYALLRTVLEQSGRAGIGSWVFHDRERTVVIRSLGGVLALHTMRFAADLVDPESIKLDRVAKTPSDRELKMARSLVESLHTRFKPSDYQDEYRKTVLQVVKRKAQGKEIEPPDEEDLEPSDDLTAALEASL